MPMPTQGHRRHRHRFSSSAAALAFFLAVPLPAAFTSVAARPGVAFAASTTALPSSSSSTSISASSSAIGAEMTTAISSVTSITLASAASNTTNSVTSSTVRSSLPGTTSRADLLSGLGLAGLLHLRQESSGTTYSATPSTTVGIAKSTDPPSSYMDNIFFGEAGYFTATETTSAAPASEAVSASTTAAAAPVQEFDDGDPPLLQSATLSTASSGQTQSSSLTEVALPTLLPSEAIRQSQSRVITNTTMHRGRSAEDDIDDSGEDDDDDEDCEDDDEDDAESDDDTADAQRGTDRTAASKDDAAATVTGQAAADTPATSTANFPILPEQKTDAADAGGAADSADASNAATIEEELQSLQKSLSLMKAGSPAAVRRALQNVIEATSMAGRQQRLKDADDLSARDKFPNVGKHHAKYEKEQAKSSSSHKFPDVSKPHEHSSHHHARDFRVFGRYAPDHSAHPGTMAQASPQAVALRQQQKAQEIALVAALDDWALITAWFKEHLPADLHDKIHRALQMPAQ